MNSFRGYLSVFLLLTSGRYVLGSGPVVSALGTNSESKAQQAHVVEGYGKLPLSFEPNEGQADSRVKFLSRGDSYSLSLTSSEALLSLYGSSCAQPARMRAMEPQVNKPESCDASSHSVVRMGLIGENPEAQIRGESELPGKSNYFVGNNPSAWHTDIVNYRKVRYEDVYPGIDLVYYGNQRQLEHDFILAPGADPKAIRLRFKGARRLLIDRDGNLKLFTSTGVAELKRPTIYQEIGGIKRERNGRYVKLGKNEIGFSPGDYDRSEKLIIDPVLVYSTYLGGNGVTVISGIASDFDGNAYVTGYTFANNFPLADPLFPTEPPDTAFYGFISKISADGSNLVYSTFLGNDPGHAAQCSGIAVDGAGNAYVTGSTSSSTFPVVNAFQPTKSPYAINAFVTKLNAQGSGLLYSTYLGGNQEDAGFAIAVDSTGAAYVTGLALSGDFPTTSGAFSNTGRVFVSKVSSAGSALEYSTRIGGHGPALENDEEGYAIAVDSLGEAMVTGAAVSPDFPLKNPLFSTLYTSNTAFVSKFNPTGSALVYSTFLGGGIGLGIATNDSGDAFITGSATSPSGFITARSPYPTSVFPSGFVTRLKSDGSAVVYSTLLGTNQTASGASIAVDATGNAFVGGVTPTEPETSDPSSGKQTDGFISKLNPTGTNLLYFTYVGGPGVDSVGALTLDGTGDVLFSGMTDGNGFPIKGGLPATPGLVKESFVAKLSAASAGQISITNTVDHPVIGPGGDLQYTITVTNHGADAPAPILIDEAVRASLLTCTVSNGDRCTIVYPRPHAVVPMSPLASGESRTVTVHASASKTAGDYNPISNIAEVSSGPPDYGSDSASAQVTVRETADISIMSSLAGSADGLLHYVNNVTNLGPDNSHAVDLVDPLPANTIYVSASTTAGECQFHSTLGSYGTVRCQLNKPGAGASVQVDVFLQATNTACPTVTNTTLILSQSIDPISTNDASTVVAQLPSSICITRQPPQYHVDYFSGTDQRANSILMNNNGDLIGYVYPGIGSFLYQNGAYQFLPTNFHPMGFNDLDQVAGYVVSAGDSVLPAIYQKGTVQTFDLGSQSPSAQFLAINNQGQIAGVFDTSNQAYKGFIYENGVAHTLGHTPDNAILTLPISINSKGEITGYNYVPQKNTPDTERSFLYTHDLLLNVAPGTYSLQSVGIDSSARIAASYCAGAERCPVDGLVSALYAAGKLQVLAPSSGPSYPDAINDCGEVVGSDQNFGPFLYSHGGFASLQSRLSPQSNYVRPLAINNRGQILVVVDGGKELLTPLVSEKCGSDATIYNTADSAMITAGNNITYTIKAANLDTAANQFTVEDDLDPSTTLVSCVVSGGGGTCSSTPGSRTITANLPSLTKGSAATITVQVKTAAAYSPQAVIMNTATLSSASTADYLSTAYTSAP